MKAASLPLHCRILTTAAWLLALGCNSDESGQSGAPESQGGAAEGTATSDSNGGAPTTTASGGASASDSDAGSAGLSDSHSGGTASASLSDSASASATDSASASATATDGASASATATDSASASASDTDGASASATATDSASASASDTNETSASASDTDGASASASTGDADSGPVCGPGLPNDNACEGCMIDHCCEAYEACVADEGCLCLLTHCSDAAVPATCALLKCDVNLLAVPVTLGYVLECTSECGLLCPVLDLL